MRTGKINVRSILQEPFSQFIALPAISGKKRLSIGFDPWILAPCFLNRDAAKASSYQAMAYMLFPASAPFSKGIYKIFRFVHGCRHTITGWPESCYIRLS